MGGCDCCRLRDHLTMTIAAARASLLTVLTLGVSCAPGPEDVAPESVVDALDPDAPFLTDAPCADAAAGLTLEETAGFSTGDAPSPLVVLMGGSTEVDAAAIRFAEAAGGGDVLVLRATGSTSSYTSWFAGELPLDPAPRAVATLRLDDASVGADDAVLCRVARADAIWLAGGDQADYLLRWPKALHEALARAVARGVSVGGTSAGAMSLGALAFDAALDSVDAGEALAAPLAERVSLSSSPFAPRATAGVLVDTHFSERDRLGRLIAFVARGAHDGAPVVGLGIDEETAVTIDGASVQVTGAGEAWLVSLEDVAPLAADTPLDGSAFVAPLSAQSTWPPTTGAEAPGARRHVVEAGAPVR
jgi:cyanophycinase